MPATHVPAGRKKPLGIDAFSLNLEIYHTIKNEVDGKRIYFQCFSNAWRNVL